MIFTSKTTGLLCATWSGYKRLQAITQLLYQNKINVFWQANKSWQCDKSFLKEIDVSIILEDTILLFSNKEAHILIKQQPIKIISIILLNSTRIKVIIRDDIKISLFIISLRFQIWKRCYTKFNALIFIIKLTIIVDCFADSCLQMLFPVLIP